MGKKNLDATNGWCHFWLIYRHLVKHSKKISQEVQSSGIVDCKPLVKQNVLSLRVQTPNHSINSQRVNFQDYLWAMPMAQKWVSNSNLRNLLKVRSVGIQSHSICWWNKGSIWGKADAFPGGSFAFFKAQKVKYIITATSPSRPLRK